MKNIKWNILQILVLNIHVVLRSISQRKWLLVIEKKISIGQSSEVMGLQIWQAYLKKENCQKWEKKCFESDHCILKKCYANENKALMSYLSLDVWE